MSTNIIQFPSSTPLVVGSIGDIMTLRNSSSDSLSKECDMVEIRLDLLHKEVYAKGASLWKHLLPFPILFTARCRSEGSPFDLSAQQRLDLLHLTLDDASLIDVEVASLPDYKDFISLLRSRDIPWIGSYHDFEKFPGITNLKERARLAKTSGANAFKCAAHIDEIDQLAQLAKFQKEDQGIPVASMGMGFLGPVSRLLCSQAGSVLNYGYVGDLETAPGQLSVKLLQQCIRSLKPIP